MALIQHCNDEERVAAWCTAVGAGGLEERRSELFWQYLSGRLDAAVSADLARHIETCEDCRRALEEERSLIGFNGSTKKVAFAVCPSGEEMLQYVERDARPSPWRRLEIKRHMEDCGLCREEAGWAAGKVAAGNKLQDGRMPWLSREWLSWKWFSWKWAGLAAAAAAIAMVFSLVSQPVGSRRFARYAQLPDVPYEAVRAEFAQAHPEEVVRFRTATDLIGIGEYRDGVEILQALRSQHGEDPSVIFFLGYVAARQARWPEALDFCTRSERRSLDGFRCWYLANVALLAGDLPLARKEVRHAKSHQPYTGPAARLEKLID